MSDLAHRLRATAEAHEDAAKGSTAPSSIKRSIARRRYLKAGSIAVAVAVVIGPLAGGGLGLTDSTDSAEPSASPTPGLTVNQSSRAYATLPLPEAGDEYFYSSRATGEKYCGSGTPEPTFSQDAFTAEFTLPDSLALRRNIIIPSDSPNRAYATVTYNGEEDLPAFTTQLVALFLDDGEVVGFTDDPAAADLVTHTQDEDRILVWNQGAWLAACDPDRLGSGLPEGNYEVVFVTEIYNTAAAAARWSLDNHNFSLPAADELRAMSEGSYVCGYAEQMGGPIPITCKPNTLVGFDLDEEAKTATVPFDASLLTREVDVGLVSDPIPATVEGSVDQDLNVAVGSDLVYEVGTELACGDQFNDVATGLETLDATWPQLHDLPELGSPLEAELWRWDYSWDTAQVTVPTDPRIWLLRDQRVDETVEIDGATRRITRFAHEVVGWLETESHNSGSIDLDVYDGPAEWPLTVTDAQWCDGFDASMLSGLFTEGTLAGVVPEPASLTVDNGDTHENLAIVITSRLFG